MFHQQWCLHSIWSSKINKESVPAEHGQQFRGNVSNIWLEIQTKVNQCTAICGTICPFFLSSEFVRMMSRWVLSHRAVYDETQRGSSAVIRAVERERPAQQYWWILNLWTVKEQEKTNNNNKTKKNKHINPALKLPRWSTKADHYSQERHCWLYAAAVP